MQFKKWVEKENKTQQEVADALGVSQCLVSLWLSGDRLPRPENMQKIVEYTGGQVQPNDFYGDKE